MKGDTTRGVCPLKFSVGENIGYECVGEECEWYGAQTFQGVSLNRCAIRSIASLAGWAVVAYLQEHPGKDYLFKELKEDG